MIPVYTKTPLGEDIEFDRWSDNDLTFDLPDVAHSFNTDTLPYREALLTRELEMADREEDLERKALLHDVLSQINTANVPDASELKSNLSDMDIDELRIAAYNVRKTIHAQNQSNSLMSYVQHIIVLYDLSRVWIEQTMPKNVAIYSGHIVQNLVKYKQKVHELIHRYYLENYTEDTEEETLMGGIFNLIILITVGSTVNGLIRGADNVHENLQVT